MRACRSVRPAEDHVFRKERAGRSPARPAVAAGQGARQRVDSPQRPDGRAHVRIQPLRRGAAHRAGPGGPPPRHSPPSCRRLQRRGRARRTAAASPSTLLAEREVEEGDTGECACLGHGKHAHHVPHTAHRKLPGRPLGLAARTCAAAAGRRLRGKPGSRARPPQAVSG